jgi:DHA3 family macrolide efflux protein-like MFS transporter
VLWLTPFIALGLILAGLRPWLPLIATGYFVVYFAAIVINSCSQAIWQKKVPADVQGRVFAMRRLLAHGVHPLAYLVSAPIAQKILEPAVSHGRLGEILAPVIGTGPGRGLGLFTMLLGLGVLLVMILGLSSPKLLALETDLPDAN